MSREYKYPYFIETGVENAMQSNEFAVHKHVWNQEVLKQEEL